LLYRFGRFQLHRAEFRLSCEGKHVPLEPKALHLLLFLVMRPGRLVRKQELLDELWPSVAVTENALTRCITMVRRALNDDSRTPEFLETVPRVGYRFIAEVTSELDPLHNLAAPISMPTTLQSAGTVDTAAPERSPSLNSPLSPALFTHRRLPGWQQLLRTLVLSVATMLVLIASVAWWLHASIPKVSAKRSSDNPASFPFNPHQADSLQVPSLPPEAVEEYQRGLYFLDRRNADASATAFRKTIQLAPQYAPGYAGLALALATSYTVNQRAVIPEATAAAKQAIQLDPENGDAYVALGCIQTMYTWQWKEAEANLTYGLRQNPKNAIGHIWYAVLLQSLGKQDAAINQAEQAVAIEPLSFYTVRMQASIFYFARRYDDALRILERAREMQPQRPNVVDNWISWADEQRGLYDDAVSHDLLALDGNSTPKQIEELRTAYRRTGWQGYWKMRLRQMSPEAMKGCGLYTAAKAYLRIGDRDKALSALHDAAAQHCFWLGMIHVDPALDSARQAPRFHQIEQLVLDGVNASPATLGSSGATLAR